MTNLNVEVEEIDYAEIMPRVAELAEELLTQAEPGMRVRLEELLDLVDAFHREGLGRLIEMIRIWRGEIFLDSVNTDEIVGTMLDVYDLGSADDREQEEAQEAVEAALEELRPFVESHGGMIALDSIVDGVVKVEMLGSCDGCPSSSATLTGGVEEALRRHWPNFRRLEVVDPNAEAQEGPQLASDGVPEAQPVLLQLGKKPEK